MKKRSKPEIYKLFEDNPKSVRMMEAIARHTREGKKILSPSELVEQLDTLTNNAKNIEDSSDRATMLKKVEAIRDRLSWGQAAISEGNALEAFAAGFEAAASMFSVASQYAIQPELHRNKAADYQQSGEYEHRQAYAELTPRNDWIAEEWKAFRQVHPRGTMKRFYHQIEARFDQLAFGESLPGERQIRNILKKRGLLNR